MSDPTAHVTAATEQQISGNPPGAEATTIPPIIRRQYLMGLRRGDAILITGCIAGFATLLVLVRNGRMKTVDQALMSALQVLRWRPFARTMWLLSWPGFSPQSRIIPPVVALALWLSGRRREGVFALSAWGTSFLSRTFKVLVHRPRPFFEGITIVPAKLDGSSFPSGHVLAYVGVYGFLAGLARSGRLPQPLCSVGKHLTTLLIVGVGPSRVYEGHHWPSDVAASYLLGFGYLRLLWRLFERLEDRSSLRPKK